MDAQRQLYWLQRNRGPRCRDQSIGGWVRRLISQPAWDRLDQAGQLAEALGALVDDEFRQHARVGGYDAGHLFIHIDRDELVWPLRVRWLYPLRQELPRRCRGVPVRRISFVTGSEGLPLPAPSA